MAKLYFFSCLFLLTTFIACKENVSGSKPDEENTTPGWNLVWSDEFDYSGKPDSTKWNYDIQPAGWVNDELQYYTSDSVNVRIENGKMIIQARYYENSPIQYTSARVVTRERASWTYGKIEVRAKLPKGRGTWPAIWMLPEVWNYGNGGWPDNGEIDIMEHVGYNPNVVHGSLHSNLYNWPDETQKTATINVDDAMDNFHNYIMEWSADSIKMFVDSSHYFTAVKDTSVEEDESWKGWPFDKNFYLILNLAIGGSWGGAQGVDNSIFPAQMEIEYVRVYRWIE